MKNIHNNRIVSHPDNKNGGWVAEHVAGSLEITEESFFSDNGMGGFTDKLSFLEYLSGLAQGELASLEKVFELMSAGIDLKVTGYELLDEKKRPFVRCTYQKDEIDHRLKIMTVDNMRTFFELYQFTILKCEVSLESLYYEALSIRPQL